MDVCNIFALRSTDPKELYKEEDPIGTENDQHIRIAAKECDKIIVAWGNHGNYKGRSAEVLKVLSDPIKYPIYALSITKTHQPAHPLYQKGDLTPELFD
jgi:hypothetical protein